MNAIHKQNFKLLVGPIEQGVPCFKHDRSEQKSQCGIEPTTRKVGRSYNRETEYFGQNVFQDQSKVTLSFKALLMTYW